MEGQGGIRVIKINFFHLILNVGQSFTENGAEKIPPRGKPTESGWHKPTIEYSKLRSLSVYIFKWGSKYIYFWGNVDVCVDHSTRPLRCALLLSMSR